MTRAILVGLALLALVAAAVAQSVQTSSPTQTSFVISQAVANGGGGGLGYVP